MRGVPNVALKEECIRLRLEKRMSLREISVETGASKGSLSVWLGDYPLSKEEKRQRRFGVGKKDRGEESRFHKAVDKQMLSRQQKGKIAEAAILFRLALYGYNVFGSPFDGDKTDWLVEIPRSGQVIKIQVKWARYSGCGLPSIPLVCCEGHNKPKRYEKGEFDFIVGYDFFTDNAYVFSWDEVEKYKRTITIKEDALERWDKLAGVAQR